MCADFYKFWFWALLLCHSLVAGLLRVPSPVVYLPIYITLDSCLCTSYLAKVVTFLFLEFQHFFFWSQVELTVVQNDLIDIELNSRNQMKHGSPTLAPSSLFPLILYTSVKFKIFSNFSYVLYLELSITLYFFLNIRVICDYFIY